MSDAASSGATDALLKRISQLEGDLAAANSEAKKRRHELRAERTAHETTKNDLKTVTTDRDAWKGKVEAGPNGLANQVTELQGKLRDRDHGDAFAKVKAIKVKGQDGKDVELAINDGVPLSEVWAAAQYKPEGDTPPDEVKVTAALQQAQASKPYLFKPATAQAATNSPRGPQQPAKPPLNTAGNDGGRGAPDTTASSGRLRVTKSQLQDPRWKLDTRNSKAVAEAQKAGTLDIVDG